jgi:predicted Zn-dependent peptidase
LPSSQITKLNNGLIIATEQMNEIESTSINIIIKVGSRYENVEINGVSHFLEHMAFKGTVRRSAKQIAEEFDAIGGYFNAYTGRESTVYNVKLLTKDLDIGLDILADILQNSLFLEEEMEKELGVIIQEIAQANDTPDDIVFDYFQEAAFPNQAIGRSILGTEEIISSFNKQTLQDYVNKYYRAPNMVISCVGNINHDQIVKTIDRLFSGLKNDYNHQLQTNKYQGSVRLYDKDLEQVQFLLGFGGVSYNNRADFYTVQLLSSVIGGGMSSRLFQEIREKRGLAYSVGAFNCSYSDCGLFGIYAATSDKQVNELHDVILNELDLAKTNITFEELERSKNQLKAGILMSRESSSARAEELARSLAIYGRVIDFNEIIAKVDNVTNTDVMDLLNKITSNCKLTITALGKLKDFKAIC